MQIRETRGEFKRLRPRTSFPLVHAGSEFVTIRSRIALQVLAAALLAFAGIRLLLSVVSSFQQSNQAVLSASASSLSP